MVFDFEHNASAFPVNFRGQKFVLPPIGKTANSLHCRGDLAVAGQPRQYRSFSL